MSFLASMCQLSDSYLPTLGSNPRLKYQKLNFLASVSDSEESDQPDRAAFPSPSYRAELPLPVFSFYQTILPTAESPASATAIDSVEPVTALSSG